MKWPPPPRLGWPVLLAVVLVALVVGGRPAGGPRTLEERVQEVSDQVRCPTCRGLSAAVSDAPAAEAIREEVRRRLASGESEEAVVDYLVASFGRDIVLLPPAEGPGLLVWLLPAGGALATVAILGTVALRRRRPSLEPTEADRALVEAARVRKPPRGQAAGNARS
ncbi:MAG: cytochrome c-type biogenesis protein [Acidimicrobiales bacterium]